MIKVEYEVYCSRYMINKALGKLENLEPVLSFDTETRGVYTKAERKEAEKLLLVEDLPLDVKKLARQAAGNSGLSFPSLVDVTHFIFGVNDHKSIILISESMHTEMMIWKWLQNYDGLLLIHNTLFDLKLMYHRVKALPKYYEDTALLAKALLNDSNTWKSKVGLKELMGSDYDPMWEVFEEYEPDNVRDPKFLKYASIDGAATFKLWNDIQKDLYEERERRGENPL